MMMMMMMMMILNSMCCLFGCATVDDDYRGDCGFVAHSQFNFNFVWWSVEFFSVDRFCFGKFLKDYRETEW